MILGANKVCTLTSNYTEPNFTEGADQADQVIQDDMKAAQEAAKAAGDAAKSMLGGVGSFLGSAAKKVQPQATTVAKVGYSNDVLHKLQH